MLTLASRTKYRTAKAFESHRPWVIINEMIEPSRHVLLIGLSPSALESLSSLLQRESFEVHTVDASAFVLDLVRGTPFELLVVGHPIAGFDISDLVEATRGFGSMCQQTAIVLVANQEHLDDAASWLDRGVNRIIALEWPRARIWQAVCDLLNIAPRVPLEVPIQIRLPADVARDIILLHTANISQTGALLTGFRSFPHGTRFEFSLELPDGGVTITGLAEVVRRTNRDREGLEGFGVRYLNLVDDSQKLLNGFIENRLGQPA